MWNKKATELNWVSYHTCLRALLDGFSYDHAISMNTFDFLESDGGIEFFVFQMRRKILHRQRRVFERLQETQLFRLGNVQDGQVAVPLQADQELSAAVPGLAINSFFSVSF